MRINSSALYRITQIPGISGFKRWDEPETWIMRGDKARNHRSDIQGVYRAGNHDRLEISDGHLAGYRPILGGPEAATRLRETGEIARLLVTA